MLIREIVAEGGRKPPPYPSLFIKDRSTIAAFDDDVPIHPIAHDKNLDYEGELVGIPQKSHLQLEANQKGGYNWEDWQKHH